MSKRRRSYKKERFKKISNLSFLEQVKLSVHAVYFYEPKKLLLWIESHQKDKNGNSKVLITHENITFEMLEILTSQYEYKDLVAYKNYVEFYRSNINIESVEKAQIQRIRQYREDLGHDRVMGSIEGICAKEIEGGHA